MMLYSPAGERYSDADLTSHLDYDVDEAALAHISREVRKARRVAELLVATRARFYANKTRKNFDALRQNWVASQWNAPIVRIWSESLSQFRKIYLSVRIDGSVWLVDERGYPTTSALIWDRAHASDSYPFNTMTKEAAIAAQVAAGSKDSYAPMEA
jgi:hypothetical protein